MAKAVVTTNEERPSAIKEKSSAAVARPAPGQLAGQVTGTFDRGRNFLRDVRSEMRKVVTPSRKEVQATTTVVLVTVFAFAAYFYVVDAVLGRGIQQILHWMGASQ